MKIFNRIAPVGNPITLKKKPLSHALCCSDNAFFYQSGTAALAAALICSKQGRHDCQLEVIMPAYACPDLVSAAIFANLKPVLIDLSADTPYLNLEQLEQAINHKTVAVIAVNFLGISEQLEKIKSIIKKQKQAVFLIEDRAQSFPSNEEELIQTNLFADISIYSFGKGKPVSLLGGGLLKIHNKKLKDFIPTVTGVSNGLPPLKALAYNIAIHPIAFWLLELLPINMGGTVYKPLGALLELAPDSKKYLQANIERYQTRQQNIDHTSVTLASLSDLSSLPTYQKNPYKLLRLPILAQSQEQRDTLLKRSRQQGLGYSALYQTTLPKVDNIPPQIAQQGSFPNAESLAQRLITLPTHIYSKPYLALKTSPKKAQRILQICSGDLWGGAEAQFLTLNKELNKDPGIELLCITFNEGDLSQRLLENNIRTEIFDETQLSSVQILLSIRGAISQFKPDVIHTHGAKENTLGSIANLFSKQAYCVRTAHGAPEFKLNYLQIHKQLFGFADWFCGRFLQKKIIAVSSELAQKLEASYPSNKIVIVENGIDIDEIQEKANAFVPDFKKQQAGAYHIGIVGRLVPVKRVDLFIETAALLQKEKLDKPVFFHIIGDGPLRSELENQAKHSKLEGNITFHGHQQNSAAYLKALDILLMTSDHEGLPMTALEAMTLNTPIISHNIGALKALLNQKTGGVMSIKHTSGSYAKTTQKLLNSFSKGTSITSTPYNKIAQAYSSSTNAKKFLNEIYKIK